MGNYEVELQHSLLLYWTWCYMWFISDEFTSVWDMRFLEQIMSFGVWCVVGQVEFDISKDCSVLILMGKHPKYEGIVILQNIRNCSLSDSVTFQKTSILLSSVCRNLLLLFLQKVLHVKIIHLMFHVTKRQLTYILRHNRHWKWCQWWKVRPSFLEYGESDTHLTAYFYVSSEATMCCYCYIHNEETWLYQIWFWTGSLIINKCKIIEGVKKIEVFCLCQLVS